MNHYRVVIVGAGLSGLRCSIELKKHGIEHIILEKTSKVGGRVASEIRQGFTLDVGFQVLLDSYPELPSALYLTHIALKKFDSGAFISHQGKLAPLFNPLKHPSQAIQTLAHFPGRWSDLVRLVRLFFLEDTKQEDFFKRSGISTLNFLKNAHFSEELIKRFFIPFFSGVFLDPNLQLPDPYFKWLFRKFAIGQATLPAKGMGAIAGEMAKNSGPIAFGSEISHVENDILTLSGGEKIKADWIVFAHSESSDLAPEKYLSTHTVYAKCPDWPDLPKSLILNANENGKILHLCFPSAIQPSYAPLGHALCSITLNWNWTSDSFDTQDFEHLKEELAFVFPKVDWKKSEFLHHYFVKKALPSWLGGNETTFLIKDHSIFIGDRYAYPSINGALRSGREAANYLIEALQKG